jgi:hypothetical protein
MEGAAHSAEPPISFSILEVSCCWKEAHMHTMPNSFVENNCDVASIGNDSSHFFVLEETTIVI